MQIPFFRPQITDKERELIEEVLSGATDMCERLEDFLQRHFNVHHAIATNNGTAAKHLALCALDLKRGDKILMSVNAFASVPQVVRQFDAEPIFVDICEDDFNICASSLERILSEQKHKKLKAAFITHVAGQCADMHSIYKIAEQYGIEIIDDANQAFGLKCTVGQDISARSVMSCFQVDPQTQKGIASAGVILTNSNAIAQRARLIRSHALITDSFDKDGNLGYIYDVIGRGQKYDLPSLCAAFCLAQMQRVDEAIARRRQIAKRYNERLKNCPHITTPAVVRDHVFTQYIIKVDKNRDSFARDLKDLGVPTSLHYVPIHLLSYYKQKYNLRVNDYPVALRVYAQILSLPIYSAMSDEQVDYICDSVIKVAQQR